ncbi:uncharacterized protein TNCV_1164791 [Trichonephila clavipes]|nr:uncharacterized protein TNCV_1164791 [Trichonephila clavipes]
MGLWSKNGKGGKEKWDDKKRVENREGSLGYPGWLSRLPVINYEEMHNEIQENIGSSSDKSSEGVVLASPPEKKEFTKKELYA